eukprot:956729-Prymnesium_polylepis.1
MWQRFERVRRPPYTKPTKSTARPQPAPAPPLNAYKPRASSWVKYRLALRRLKGVAGLCPPGGGRGAGRRYSRDPRKGQGEIPGL